MRKGTISRGVTDIENVFKVIDDREKAERRRAWCEKNLSKGKHQPTEVKKKEESTNENSSKS